MGRKIRFAYELLAKQFAGIFALPASFPYQEGDSGPNSGFFKEYQKQRQRALELEEAA